MGEHCRTCGIYVIEDDLHSCPPSWLVWQPKAMETVRDAREVYAWSAKEAACKHAKGSERNDSYRALRLGATYMVRSSESGQVSWFDVSGEADVTYTATPVAR